jgi:hypothetical protein
MTVEIILGLQIALLISLLLDFIIERMILKREPGMIAKSLLVAGIIAMLAMVYAVAFT